MYGKFFVLFAIMFTGYFFRKCKIIDEAMNPGLNKFIVYFAYPCLIVHNIGTLDMNKSLFAEFVLMFVLSLVFLGIYSAYSAGYGKVRHFPRESSNVAEFAMVSPNNAFMGFPVALIFFGERGLLLMLANNAAMNFIMFTYGLALMRRNDRTKEKRGIKAIAKGLAKLFLNPNISALIVAFFICVNGISIPAVVDEYLLYIGNVSTPMAMVFIGSTLAGCNFLEIIRNRVVIESTLNKVLWIPIFTYFLTFIVPVSPLIRAMLVLGSCFPTAATVSMVAEQELQDKEMASKILFLTTVFSMITIPVAINLINTLIMG